MHVKICEQCGAEFEAKRSDAKYCSKKCRQIVSTRKIRGTKNVKICLICGTKFITDGKREYCCDECSETAHIINRTHGDYRRYELYNNDDGSWED